MGTRPCIVTAINSSKMKERTDRYHKWFELEKSGKNSQMSLIEFSDGLVEKIDIEDYNI